MPSLDFKLEKKLFRQFYDQHLDSLEEAKETFAALARSLLKQVPGLQLSKIEARVKDREECIHKFQSNTCWRLKPRSSRTRSRSM